MYDCPFDCCSIPIIIVISIFVTSAYIKRRNTDKNMNDYTFCFMNLIILILQIIDDEQVRTAITSILYNLLL